MITAVRLSIRRGATSMLRDIRDMRAQGETGMAIMLTVLFVVFVGCGLMLGALAAAGLWTMWTEGEWAVAGMLVGAFLVARFIWWLAEP